LEWAFQRTSRVLFFPDQHLGRNTALGMGITNDQMPVWNPYEELGGNTEDDLRRSSSVALAGALQRSPDVPRRTRPPVPPADSGDPDPGPSGMHAGGQRSGRRLGLHRQDHQDDRKQAPPGSKWAIGTELHLVNRLKQQHPDKEIHFLSPVVCMCATMYRIDLAHLCWSLENLASGHPVNVIRVDDETTRWSLIALERMLNLRRPEPGWRHHPRMPPNDPTMHRAMPAGVFLHGPTPVLLLARASRPHFFLKFRDLRFQGRQPFSEILMRHVVFSPIR
jgi:quinolinate synthase